MRPVSPKCKNPWLPQEDEASQRRRTLIRKRCMDADSFGAEEFFAELDLLGEAEVQRLFDTGAYAPRQEPFVREWLLRRAEERARRREEGDRG
jgi:hypothetical protein